MEPLYSAQKAWVIAVSEFERPEYRLPGARPDGEAVATLLREELGFEVRTRYDREVRRDDLRRVFEEELMATDPEDGVVVFVATHGLTVTSSLGEERGFLVPHDGSRERSELYRNLSLAAIRDDYLAHIPAKHVLLILDACYGGLALRDAVAGPHPEDLDEAVLRHLTRGDRPIRQVLAAGGKEERVLDGGLHGHSIFAGRLMEALREGRPYVLAEQVGVRVRERVVRDALERHHRQTPHFGFLSGGEGSFVFVNRRWAGGGAARNHGNPAAGAGGRLVKCPRDGRKNPEAGTFQCRVCGEDDLCLKHLDEARGCCDRCAARLEAEERQTAEARRAAAEAARQEAERQEAAQREAARCERERREREAAAQRERAAAEAEARRKDPGRATKETPWENSLGMRFVPVPVAGGKVVFSVWPTRVRDYAAYAAAKPGVDGSWKDPEWRGVKVCPSPECPVVNVSWEDARAFCAWLTESERHAGRLPAGWQYRLPTDAEWSWAVGIGDREKGRTPQEKDEKLQGVYPWGTAWPPPKGAGNYADERLKSGVEDLPWWRTIIKGYDDGYAATSPVGSFAANELGLYDLSGNVWEWCGDYFNGKDGNRVLRGGSWNFVDPANLLSSYRLLNPPDFRYDDLGFRVVLGEDSAR